ncbi:MAG: hypothetical protein LBH24_00540 [Clostridiales bacterium]|jgi:O-antigen/teichoic acid export membrane protein|nr:hypothetical protein [Clostridiales bacterium]
MGMLWPAISTIAMLVGILIIKAFGKKKKPIKLFKFETPIVVIVSVLLVFVVCNLIFSHQPVWAFVVFGVYVFLTLAYLVIKVVAYKKREQTEKTDNPE